MACVAENGAKTMPSRPNGMTQNPITGSQTRLNSTLGAS